MSGERAPQPDVILTSTHPDPIQATTGREESLLEILDLLVASDIGEDSYRAIAQALRDEFGLHAVVFARLENDRVAFIGSAPQIPFEGRSANLSESIFRHASTSGQTVTGVDDVIETRLFNPEAAASLVAHVSNMTLSGKSSVAIASFAASERFEAPDLAEKLSVVATVFASRLRAVSQLASERDHLDRLIKLQNLTARIIRQDELVDIGDDLLDELASAFAFDVVRIGLRRANQIEFFQQYREAIVRRGVTAIVSADGGIAGDVLRVGAPRFLSYAPPEADQVIFGRDVKQMIAVPLRINGDVEGVLAAAGGQKRPLVIDDLSTLMMLAESFGLVLANFRRFYEVERRNHQLRLVDSLVTLIAERAMIQQAVPEISREIADRFGFQLVAIGLIRNEQINFTLASSIVPMPPIKGFSGAFGVEQGIAGRVIKFGAAELIPDIRSDPDFVDSGWGARSEICVPIRSGGEIIGVLNVESGPERPLDEPDLEVLSIIARHLGIAFENEALLASERSARRALEALQQVSTIVTSTLDVDEALRRVVDTLGGNFDYRYVVAGLIDGQFIQPSAAHGIAFERLVRIPLHGSRIGTVAQTGEMLFVTKISSRTELGLEAFPDGDSLIVAPISRDDTILGVLIVVGSRDRDLTPQDVRLLQMYAQHAGVVLDNARMYEDARRMAYIDPITQLPNHRQFQERLAADFERARRDDRHLAVIVMDLDGFKEVNDRYGHLEGDAILTAVGKRLGDWLRDVDLLARYAGDEFVVLLPDADTPIALRVADRLRAAISNEPFVVTGGELAHLSVSVGISLYPDHGSTPRVLVARADQASYVAKRGGRDRVHLAGS